MTSFCKAVMMSAILLAFVFGESRAGVSISVGEPGFYGRIDIGNFPPPRLLYREPIIVRPVTTWYPPIYLRVPPGHAKKWYKHCHEYDACGRPVYFVDDLWYREVYVPRYREIHPPAYRPYHPPVIIHKPHYYEYRKYEHKPPKKVYIHEKSYDHDRYRHRDDGHYRYRDGGKERYPANDRTGKNPHR